jgi:hypothetical protein
LLKVEQVVGGELFAIDGVGAVLRDVSLYQAPFEDIAYTYSKFDARVDGDLWLD